MAFIISMSVLSLLFVPKVISVRNSSGSDPQRPQAPSTIHDLTINSLKAQVKNLERIIRESGVGGSLHVPESLLDQDLVSSPTKAPKSETLELDPSSVEYPNLESLPPVVEKEEEDSMDPVALPTEPKEPQDVESLSKTEPRSSMSVWLNE